MQFSLYYDNFVYRFLMMTCKYNLLPCELQYIAEAETACQKWGGSAFMKWDYLLVIYIHSEYIRHRLLVFNTFFMTTSNFGGAQPPYQKDERERETESYWILH